MGQASKHLHRVLHGVFRPRRRGPAVAVLSGVAIAAALSGGSGAGTSVAAVHGCRDVMFIGARGSGERLSKTNRGLGAPLYEMAMQLEKDVANYGEQMGMLGIVYSADSVKVLVPSVPEAAAYAAATPPGALGLYYLRHLKPYAASVNDGVRLTIEAVHAVLGKCPETELVLAGYSQGAMAVHQAERRLEREGDEEALGAIGGTLLLGDGDRTPLTDAKLIGGASPMTTGIRVALHGIARPQDVAEPETTVEICAVNDIVCDFSPSSIVHGLLGAIKLGTEVHTNYLKNPGEKAYLSQAVDWLASEMGLTG